MEKSVEERKGGIKLSQIDKRKKTRKEIKLEWLATAVGRTIRVHN
jgi:hypothetical protein